MLGTHSPPYFGGRKTAGVRVRVHPRFTRNFFFAQAQGQAAPEDNVRADKEDELRAELEQQVQQDEARRRRRLNDLQQRSSQ